MQPKINTKIVAQPLYASWRTRTWLENTDLAQENTDLAQDRTGQTWRTDLAQDYVRRHLLFLLPSTLTFPFA